MTSDKRRWIQQLLSGNSKQIKKGKKGAETQSSTFAAHTGLF